MKIPLEKKSLYLISTKCISILYSELWQILYVKCHFFLYESITSDYIFSYVFSYFCQFSSVLIFPFIHLQFLAERQLSIGTLWKWGCRKECLFLRNTLNAHITEAIHIISRLRKAHRQEAVCRDVERQSSLPTRQFVPSVQCDPCGPVTTEATCGEVRQEGRGLCGGHRGSASPKKKLCLRQTVQTLPCALSNASALLAAPELCQSVWYD